MLKHFIRNRKGAAALELGIMLPLLTGAFIATIDVGQAITVRQDVSKRMRLGIEGVLRFGHDTQAAQTFANSDPDTEFAGTAAANDGITVTITSDYQCRESDGSTTAYSQNGNNCANVETWYSIQATGTHTGLFGTQTTPKSIAKVLIE